MIVPPTTRQAAAEDFLLIHGLLSAHVLGKMPIERLARDYGYTAARLRTKILDHLGMCLAALAIEVPTAMEPEAAPVVPPVPADPPRAATIRIRTRPTQAA